MASTVAPNGAKIKFSNLFKLNLHNLYLSPKLSDVRFLFPKRVEGDALAAEVGNVKREFIEIPAHKLILSASSEAFHTMFCGSMPEKGDVEITDSSPEAFKEFLQFFYLDNGTFTKENIERVMYLVDKYMINDYLTVCSRFLMDVLTMDDVCSGYALSILYKHPELKEFCEEKIRLNSEAVFDSEDFLECDREVLAEVLKLDLDCKVTTVVDGCMKWAKNACKKNGLDENSIDNLRTQLDECLFLIRFGNMTLEELSHCNSRYGDLLQADELDDAMKCIQSKKYISKKFIQPPQLSWNKNNIWRCTSNSGPIEGVLRSETVQITSNKTTLLGGVYGIKFRKFISNTYVSTSAAIEIVEVYSVSEYVRFSGTIHFKGENGAHLKLPTPIIIKEGITYEIRLRFKEGISITGNFRRKGKVESPKGLQIDFDTNNIVIEFHYISGLDLLDV